MIRFLLALWFIVLLIAFTIDAEWTCAFLIAGVVFGGPPFAALGWWMHRYNEGDPWARAFLRMVREARRG